MSVNRNVSILLDKTKLAIRRGNYRNAEKILKRVIALRIHPRFMHQAWLLMGSIFSALQEFQKAIECCDKSLKFNKYYYKTHLLRGICLRKLNLIDSAILSFNEALKQKVDDPGTIFQKSIVLAKKGNEEEASIYFQKILDLPYNFFVKEYEENHEALENSTIHLHNITFLGVEHGCAHCIQNIKQIFEQEQIDALALELDFIRLFSFMEKFGKNGRILSEKYNLKKFNDIDFANSNIWDDQFYEASLYAWYAYRTFPGQEMMEAVQLAEKKSIPYFLLDQNIHTTQEQIHNLKNDWNRIIIIKRDLKMISKLMRIQSLYENKPKILCIVGKAHLYGIFSRFIYLDKLKKDQLTPILLWEG